MAKRSYDQYCPLACALDLVGERWTLLIVRDLMTGPKRYTDLRHGLPGLATDLLTERLRRLEEAGAVRRRELAPPAATTVYELTERGRELEPAVYFLARFGFSLLGEPPAEPPPADRLALLLRVLFDPDGAPTEPETWVFDGGERRIAVTIGGGEVQVHSDAAELPREASATFRADVPTLYGVVMGRLDVADALAGGALRVEGDEGAARRLRRAFPVPAPVAA
jgi:DNA-binding HxlR family transcriptional regulator